jgi:hypothetical protein
MCLIAARLIAPLSVAVQHLQRQPIEPDSSRLQTVPCGGLVEEFEEPVAPVWADRRPLHRLALAVRVHDAV